MKKNKLIFWFNDNYVIVYSKQKDSIYREKFKSVKQDIIIDNALFSKELERFFKKYKIRLSIIGYNVIVIKNSLLEKSFQENIENQLTEYFNHIEFIDIFEYLDIKKDTALINITDHSLDYIYKDKYLRVNTDVFKDNLFNIVKHIINVIYTPRNIVLYGNNDISKVASNISEKYKIKTTFLEDYPNFLIIKYLEKNAK